MNRVLIGVPAIIFATACVIVPARALPIPPSGGPTVGAAPVPLLQVRYHRHHWHFWHHRHYRHYGHLRHRYAHGAEEAVGGAVKPGRWQFTAELQTPAAAKSPEAAQAAQPTLPQSGGGINTSYYGCITSERAVPAEFGPQCKLDSTDRNGPAITWSMTCTNPQGAVRSDGVAQYSGDTMEATMISHLPGADGKVTDMTQHITGRYVGPCTQAMQ
jgi:hypothetical protein